MKGIVLAGGFGKRLGPITTALSKQLVPVYDKPMIYYPVSLLMLANIKEILIISTPDDIPSFEKLFGDGSQFGLKISYKIQEYPGGLAQAFLIGADFIGSEEVCLVLGDNIIYGHGLTKILENASELNKGAHIFAYQVSNPSSYGVVTVDEELNVIEIEEKPEIPKSNLAVPGIYFYDNQVVELVKSLEPSARGELEITDLNRIYMKNKSLKVKVLGRGFAWFDTGSPSRLLKASNFIEAIQKRQNIQIACLEEIAFNKGYISKEAVKEVSEKYKNSEYGKSLQNILGL
ncbi:MAG: Glucose-1-phosphate thymidylyltransferase [Candidatus Heimdallarchaeota archaeon LC_2]|nr:MAG: Glucose-1-phosphate thymidylyltransferase [Candidatus Heimdallarchaeota archaeon LC_2]